jgi:hypothetical protein
MSIEQFEISIGSRVPQVPARQNLKAMQYQAARAAAIEASKVKAVPPANEPKKVNGTVVQEELIVHEPIVQEVINSIIELKDDRVTDQATEEELHAEFNTEEFTKLTPEVLPAQDSDSTGASEDAFDEPEDTVEDTNDESESVTKDVIKEPESVTEDVADELEGTIDEPELYIEEMLDISESDEDIVLVHESTVLELDDDNFEIQEIQEIQEENK